MSNKFLTIGITLPHFIENEGERIADLLTNSVDYIHVRKPYADASMIAALLESIPKDLLERITLHDHFELSESYPIGGLHLNSRTPTLPEGWNGRISRSLHSIEELSEIEELTKMSASSYEYVTLSPIYNSISKLGYKSAFPMDLLWGALSNYTIPVIALGGVTPDKYEELQSTGFSGAAMLGHLWRSKTYY